MTRQPQLAVPAFGITLGKLAGAVLGAAALAAPAQAAVIGFENGYGPVAHGESYQEAGFTFGFDANRIGADDTNAVGAFVDSTDPWMCEIACPTNNPGMYYGAFNDSVVFINAGANNPFRIRNLDASFIGNSTTLSGYPTVAGLLRVQGFAADGSTAFTTLNLDGPSASGFTFGNYSLGAFGEMDFVEIALFGFTCAPTGSCSAFNSNKGQFAIDNLDLILADAVDVPEPATGLIFGLGLVGLVAARRRNNNKASA